MNNIFYEVRVYGEYGIYDARYYRTLNKADEDCEKTIAELYTFGELLACDYSDNSLEDWIEHWRNNEEICGQVEIYTHRFED